MDRIAHFLTEVLMSIATIVILGPGASSVLAQQAAKQAVAVVNRRRQLR